MWRRLWPFLIAIMVAGCGRMERYGRGKAQELVIVYDGAQREALLLKDSLGEVFYTPHPEPLFTVLPLRVEQFAPYEGYKNVLILATTASDAFGLFKKVFRTSEPGMYTVKNAIGEGDFVLGILAEEEVALWTFVHGHQKEIKSVFLNRLKDILRLKVYFAGHDKRMSKKVEEAYGFSLDFPKGWAFVVKDSNFVSWAKHYPDRFIFVFRERRMRSLDPLSLMDLRDSLTQVYYEGDRIVRDLVKMERDSFLGVTRTRLYGAWENDSLVIGGPFFTWAFNLPEGFFMIDGGVYAPERTEKLEFVLREEIIAATFRP